MDDSQRPGISRGALIWFMAAVLAANVAGLFIWDYRRALEVTPAPMPSPVTTRAEVIASADAWKNANPVIREWMYVAGTGSMKPIIDEFSIVLLEAYEQGTPIRTGETLVFHKSDKFPNVLHMATAQNADSVWMSGYNNKTSDGWFSKKTVKWRVVGQLYLPRPAPLAPITPAPATP